MRFTLTNLIFLRRTFLPPKTSAQHLQQLLFAKTYNQDQRQSPISKTSIMPDLTSLPSELIQEVLGYVLRPTYDENLDLSKRETSYYVHYHEYPCKISMAVTYDAILPLSLVNKKMKGEVFFWFESLEAKRLKQNLTEDFREWMDYGGRTDWWEEIILA